jgi:hypothetical protein
MPAATFVSRRFDAASVLSRGAEMPMKRILAACLVSVGLAASPAFATAPTLTLTIATAVAVPAFPAIVSIPLTIAHADDCPGMGTGSLRCLQVFDVAVNGSSILPGGVPIGSAFDGSSVCTAAMTSNGLTCSTSGTPPTQANVSVPWTVAGPGAYVVSARIRHGGVEGDDEETVSVQLIVAEYPAPPSIANDYIKAQNYKLTGGKRGCVINAIAQNHAHDERYGPKGGPYDKDLVAQDVEVLLASCQ